MDAPTPIDATNDWLDLSAAQRAVWLDGQLDAAPLGYQLGGWARIDAAVDVAIARQAVSLVMARHDALRLRVDPLLPRQRLDASAAPPLDITDLSGAADPDAAFAAFREGAFATALPLGDAPLFRVDLLRAAPRRWYALWRCHHLIADATSVALALARWTEAYRALAGEDDTLAPPSSFTALLAADATYQASARHAADLAYWRARFADLPEPLFTPVAPVAPVQPERWQLAGVEYQQFAAVCAAYGVTTQRGLLAVLALLLARVFGRRDISLGVALHRRDFATRDTIGMLAGLLPVRCAIDGWASPGANARAIGLQLDQDFRHQRVALDALGRALGGQGQRAPLFDAVVSHLLDEAPESGGGLYRGPERMPLALYAVERRAGIAFELVGNPAFVDAALLGVLADGLRRAMALLGQDVAAADLPLVAVADGNAPPVGFSIAPLPVLFARQVARTPDAAAVTEGDRSLSYADLDGASDALAAALQARGVTRESVVGVALHRSAHTVVALLAVLKAGGVYLPLDPAYPPPRLAFMLADAGAALVITDASVAALLPDAVPQLAVPAAPACPRPVALDPDQLAYIVYTSGSTGTPKGVAVSHASAANLAFARVAGHDPIGPGDRVLAAISVGFDVSIGQLLLPLLAGACVVVAPDLRTLSGAAFWALLAGQRVSHVNSVPSFLDSVLAEARPGALVRLMLGGEALDGALCRRLRAALPGVRVVNMYGPTEACIDATAYPVPADAPDAPLPIGRPLANYRAHVLDRRLRALPAGVPGTLYLGGAGLARGYVGQPGLTAARFVADPFGPPGSRLYDTGDRALWRSDGTLMFLGRADAQVKIRGFRVEPGEIEAALRAHAGVAQAAVLARPAPGGLRLVAYVVGTARPDDLRAHLATRLPPHLVPAAFVALDALPLTPNGKLDRAALPEPVAMASDAQPVGAREALLCALFAELTKNSAGRHDGFFAIGGDSIGAIRLVSLARSRGGLAIEVRDVFAHPTPAALALVARDAEAPVAADIPATGALLPTPLQHRLLASGAPIARFHQAVALHPPAGLTPERVEAALVRLVDGHPALRLVLDVDGLRIAETAPSVRLQRVRQADLAARAATLAEFDLAHGATLNALWAEPATGAPTLVLAIHHFAVDGVSWRILLEDLALCATAPVAVAPSLPLRAWTAHLHRQVLLRDHELPLWRQMLAPTRLRTARPPGANTIGTARTLSRALPAQASARLLASAAVYRAEINDLLLAALGIALADWQGDAVHAVAVEGHGREAGDSGLDLSRTVGWFTSVYPVRLDLTGLDIADALDSGPAAGEAIRRVKATLRRLPDHGIGYGLLRHLNRALDDLDEPHILFNYLGRFAHAGASGADQWRPAPLPGIPDDAARERSALLEANALLDGDGALQVAWTFAPSLDVESVAALAERFVAALDAVATHCTQRPLPPSARLIAADFPLAQAAGLDAALLADLAAAVPDVQAVVPLTPLQRGLAFETLVRGAAEDPYHVQGVLRLEGAVDADAMRAAWLQLTQRHDVLRLALPTPGLAAGLAVLRPAEASLDWRWLDWRDKPDAEQALEALLLEDRREAFDLARGRLLRLTVIGRGPRAAWLMVGNHHALLDGWSMPVLLGEWFRLCEGLALPPTLPWLAFLDRLARADRAQAAAFWAARFAGLPADAGALLLPPPDHPVVGSGEAIAVLDAAATAALERVARAHGLTLASLALGAWALLLHPLQTAPSAEFVLGVTSGGRPADLAGSEHAVGLFIQTAPLRLAMAPATRLADWLHALQTALAEQEPHGWLGLSAIRAAAGLPADRTPFDALFVFENYPAGTAPPDAKLRLVSAQGRDATHYPLALAASRSTDGLRLRLTHDRRVVGAEDAAMLAGRLVGLLTALAGSDLATKLADLPLVAVADGNAPPVGFSIAPLPVLFARQVARTPDAAAVTEGDRSLSYADLDGASDALAAALQARGVTRESVVGVALHRSAHTVVALLAVLKAGGVYLPLDPAYPPPRLAFMLADAGAALVITDASVAALLPDAVPQLAVPAAPACPRPVALDPDQLAYIVYTSGSTGTPKGVAVSHASAANLAFARVAGHDPIGPGDRVLAAISVGFDVSIGQLLLPLLAGACVVVAPDLRTLSGAAFWALLAGQRVSHVNSVPSFLDSVLAEARPGALVRLMLGGEALDGALCRRLRAALPGVRVVNMYGPTEACIDATAYPVPADAPDAPLPIGRPLANYRAHVLDRRLRALPAGVPGTLYLGGAGLARGYVGQPGLTAARFVADPFGPPGSRLYDTGDRALWRSDGTLMFLGRADAQVKIRGFRVEPGEIEAALRAHAGVAQAAVLARPAPGGLRLVAYVVGTARPDDLRAHLATRLPPHLVPAAFMALDALPLTPNGKLDRAALPDPVAARVDDISVARDATEFRVQAVWQDVLGHAVGLHDDFFDSGGDSLLGIRLIGTCNTAFGVALPVSTLFAARTVAAMAAAIRQHGAPSASRLVTLRADSGAPWVVLHPQGGTVFCYAPLLRHLDDAMLGLQAAGLEEGEALSASVEDMAADYVAALRAACAGPYRLIGYSFGGLVAYQMAHLLGADAASVALLDTWRPGGSPAPDGSEAAILAMLAEDIGLHAPAPDSTAGLFAAAQAAGLVPADFSLAQAERIVAVYRNNARLAERYRPPPGVAAPLLQLRALRRDTTLPDWSPLAAGAVVTRDLDCTHRGLIGPETAPQLAALLRETPHG